MAFKTWIYVGRAMRQLTRSELARKAELSNQYLWMLESGRKANPSVDVIKRLAEALGVPVQTGIECCLADKGYNEVWAMMQPFTEQRTEAF